MRSSPFPSSLAARNFLSCGTGPHYEPERLLDRHQDKCPKTRKGPATHIFKGLNLHFLKELTRDFKCPNCTVINLLNHYACFSLTLCTWFRMYLRLLHHNGNNLHNKLHELEVMSHRMGEHGRKGPPALCGRGQQVTRPRAPRRPLGEEELGQGEQRRLRHCVLCETGRLCSAVTFSRPKPFHCPNSKIEFYWLFTSVPEGRACLTTSVSLPMLLDLLLFLPELVEGSRGKSINATLPHHRQ